MKKRKLHNLLGLVTALGALVAQSGVALAQGTCTATFTTATGTTELTCATSLSEDARGFAVPQGNFSLLSVSYLNGQDGAQGFMLDNNGNIRCTGALNKTRGTTVNTSCTAPTGQFRIVVN